jgi:hypothetical protein
MDIAWLTPVSLESLDNQPIAGRMFRFNDPRGVAVVDEEAAAKLFGRLTVGVVIRDSTDLPIEIIGVVKKNQMVRNSKDAQLSTTATSIDQTHRARLGTPSFASLLFPLSRASS